MSSAREIRTKIGSIRNTCKITRAMEMVAASKMRKAQDRMTTSRPYANKIRTVIGHLAYGHPEFRHVFLETREIKRAGFILVTSDRGLCGGLNANLLRAAINEVKTLDGQGIEVDFCAIGGKGLSFFKRYGGNIVAEATHLGDAPTVTDLIGIVKVMLDAYEEGKIDALYLLSNEFINTMSQKPEKLQLLPLEPVDDGKLDYRWDYIYEPEAKKVLVTLLTRYIESQVYQGVIENIACEQASRMVAMKSATDNANKLIDDLEMVYNKARQAAITQEIAEIVGGADAV